MKLRIFSYQPLKRFLYRSGSVIKLRLLYLLFKAILSFYFSNRYCLEKLYTCKNGEDNQGHTVRFARDNDFYKDDLVVFFSK